MDMKCTDFTSVTSRKQLKEQILVNRFCIQQFFLEYINDFYVKYFLKIQNIMLRFQPIF